MSETLLDDLQEDLAARLEADSYFTDIPVFAENRKMPASEVQQRLASMTAKNGKRGIAVILLALEADVKRQQLVDVLDARPVFRVLENPELNSGTNGTRKHANAVARRITWVIGGYHPAGLANRINPDKPTIVPVDDPVAPVAKDVCFTCLEEDRNLPTKVSPPTISPSSGLVPQTVTITCATSGAAIYYTLDGSHPAATNTHAVLYTAPVAVAAAGAIRACAYKTGMIASDTPRGDYLGLQTELPPV